MQLTDLEIVIENKRGTYKKFADSLEEYPILGVTFPTEYGYIKGYASEDGHDLDVFVGSGKLVGFIKMKRDDFPSGIETKTFLNVSEKELEEIKKACAPVLGDVKIFAEEKEFLEYVQRFKSKKQ